MSNSRYINSKKCWDKYNAALGEIQTKPVTVVVT